MWWKGKRGRGKWNSNETRCSSTYLEGSSAGFFTVSLLLTGRRFETWDACFVELHLAVVSTDKRYCALAELF